MEPVMLLRDLKNFISGVITRHVWETFGIILASMVHASAYLYNTEHVRARSEPQKKESYF